MDRRLLPSTVAMALVLGTVAASAQTQRPSDRNMNAPQATQPQPPTQTQGNKAQGNQQPPPNAQSQNPAPAAPSATTGQAAPAPQQNAPAANNRPQQPQQPGQAQMPPQQGQAQQGQAQQGQAQQGQAQQPAAQQGQAQQAPAQQGQTQPSTAQGNAAGGNANTQQNANTNASANQGVITLNEQQTTRVSAAIRETGVRPLTNVNFSIAVGTTVPADVVLGVLPPPLVEIVPQYSGFNFVVVEKEVLIIDPSNRTIVAVMPVEAQQTTGVNQAAPPPRAPAQAAAPPPAPAPSQATAPPPRERTKLETRREQREMRRQAERHRKAEKDKRVIIEERRSTTGAGPRGPRMRDVPDHVEGPPVEVYRDEPRDRHPSVRDIPLIGPLLGGPHDD